MKISIKLLPLVAMAMFVNETTAQWTKTGVTVAPTVLTDNVGIGISTAAARLHVSATSSNAMIINGGSGMYVTLNEGGVYRGYIGSYAGAAADVDFGTGSGNTLGKLHLAIESSPKLTIDNSGKIGVGTVAPASQFHIVSSTNEPLRIDGGAGMNMVMFEQGVFRGYIGSFAGAAEDVDFGTAAVNTNGKLHLTIKGVPQLTVDASGAVSIGTLVSAPGYKLSVNGKLICEELKIRLKANWPDYVFTPEYKSMTTQELEEYIATNKHLPGMPSAIEVEKNGGIEVGEMQRLLLQKVEELTLLTIKQQKQIDLLIDLGKK